MSKEKRVNKVTFPKESELIKKSFPEGDIINQSEKRSYQPTNDSTSKPPVRTTGGNKKNEKSKG